MLLTALGSPSELHEVCVTHGAVGSTGTHRACGEAGREAGGASGVNERCRQDFTINLQDLGNREVIPSGINLEKGKQIASFGFYFAVLFGFVYLGSFQLEISRNSPVVHFSSNAGCESCGDLNAQRAHTSAGRRAGARGGGSAPGTLLVTGPSPPPRRPSPPGQQTPALELGS